AAETSAPSSLEGMKAGAHDTRKSDGDMELEGIDMEAAILYCGSMEDFKELAGVYCSSGEKYTKQLKDVFDAKDWKNYAILAHTIKSTSKTLGANGLAELAFTQEMAGKEENEDIILMNHDQFAEEYDRMLKMLDNYLDGGEEKPEADKTKDKDKRKGSTKAKTKEKAGEKGKDKAKDKSGRKEVEDWDALRAELTDCLERFEATAFTECLDKYSDRTLDGRLLTDVLSGVEKKAQSFDFEGAIAELNVIGGEA
ncbi:MAG: Hpt domain-containing protein, partial [Mogibacterium sp.]|nr:Hpt domain-containing protein [Mogibacterium sp.]